MRVGAFCAFLFCFDPPRLCWYLMYFSVWLLPLCLSWCFLVFSVLPLYTPVYYGALRAFYEFLVLFSLASTHPVYVGACGFWCFSVLWKTSLRVPRSWVCLSHYWRDPVHKHNITTLWAHITTVWVYSYLNATGKPLSYPKWKTTLWVPFLPRVSPIKLAP